MIRRAPAPWLKEGERHLWISVPNFARLQMRSRKTVYRWLSDGATIPEFGYRAFRDIKGRWRIKVRPTDLTHLND
jgi:hypothetical protein